MLTTDKQKLVEDWIAHIKNTPGIEVLGDSFDDLCHMARLGAWYHKHQVLIENVLHTAITEMESSNHPQFLKAIESIRALLAEKPRD